MPNQGSGEQPSYPSETLHNGPAVIACLPRTFGDDFVWKGLRLVMLGPERDRERSQHPVACHEKMTDGAGIAAILENDSDEANSTVPDNSRNVGLHCGIKGRCSHFR